MGKLSFIIALITVVGGVVLGYYLFSLIPETGGFEDNITYEISSFTSQNITAYNITINTQLPQIVKNPIWKTPIKIYIDDEAAKRRRLHERPVEGLRKAMSTLEQETGGTIKFLEVNDAREADVIANFTFNFSDEHAVGEGGPTLYLRAGIFTVIKKGELHLLPVEYECTSYTLAMHEIGHVLGFGHSKVYNSVMWPKFGCLTNNISEIINDVSEIYRNYKPDLSLPDARATSTGNFMNLYAEIANLGPKEARNATLIIYFNGKKAHAENIPLVDVGYSVNFKGILPVTEYVSEIKLEIEYDGEELSKQNNVLVMNLEK